MKRIFFIFLLFPLWLSAQNVGHPKPAQKPNAKPANKPAVTYYTPQKLITGNLPQTIYPGHTYKIKVSIQKDGIATFAELILPNSDFMEITNIKTDNGKIYKYPGSINIVWSPLPAKQVLNVEYEFKLKSGNLPDYFTLGNVFTFFKDGKRGQDEIVNYYWKVGRGSKIKYIADNQ